MLSLKVYFALILTLGHFIELKNLKNKINLLKQIESKLKDNFEFKILEKKYYMIGGKRDWVILENIN